MHLEKQVVEMIAAECGQNYVKKIASMFTDINSELEIDVEELKEVIQPGFYLL